MQLDRRAFLTGVAGVAGAGLAGCSDGRSGENVPEPGTRDGDGPGSQDLGGGRHAVLRPSDGMVEDWRVREGDGETTFEVDLRNIDPANIEGMLRANVTHREDGQRQYETNFTMTGESTSTVELTIPVSYEEYTTNMSQPAFSVEDLEER
ncbi:hypothetical protein GJ629_03875 [Halapricum sp. CBA1109]|uniref:hypothetical protein n=1 Tax=Halapricum sp. CBA1109 TaxID=2668068 RepID=UPI0012F76352|nr:hypothetical protein [Halapricum sp. CBA1109]MUV89144.1 hypothetical protein [Halapricum sp. CBA1109]